MTVRLRAHHLLCMLTFVGEGYTPAFTGNYRRLAERLSAGEEIELVSGPDDICAPLLGETSAHCLERGPAMRDRQALKAAALSGTKIEVGSRIVPDAAFLSRMRKAFANGTIRSACAECEWSSLCDRIAGCGFEGALVVALEEPRGSGATS